MKKSTEAALAVGVAYLLMKLGLAIWRHPIISAIVFAALYLPYALGGPPLWEAVRSARSITPIYALVFIVGLAFTGRGFAALLWFMALMVGVSISQAWIECAQNTCYYMEPAWYATTRASNGLYVSSLDDYHWWFHHSGWLPSPAAIVAGLVALAGVVVKDIIFPRSPNDETQRMQDQKGEPSHSAHSPVVKRMWWQKQERSHPTHEKVHPVDACKTVEKSQVTDGAEASSGRFAAPAEQKRILELEAEVHTLTARIKRLREVGKAIIAQREEWKTRALASEEFANDLLDSSSEHDERFDMLRRLVAKELHPDFCDGSQLEKMVRAELFKRLWPEIERIAVQGTV